MKNVLMIIGMFAIGMFVCLAVLVGIFAYFGTKYDASSKAYVDTNIPPIISNWTVDELEKREGDQFRQVTSDDKLKELFAIFTRLGPMKSYDGATGDANMAMFSGTGFQVTARYVVKATFQNGEAEIRITLSQVDGEWKIVGFRVDSPLFVK